MVVKAHKPPPAKKSHHEKNHKKVSAGASSTEIMEQSIWKELPVDLFEPVLARLPIETFFRFRLVCKKWNSLLTSQSFSQHCAEVRQPHSWFYTITSDYADGEALFDPSRRTWHNRPVARMNRRQTRFPNIPITSAGGLLCSLDTTHNKICVSNPLTKLSKELTPMSGQYSHVAVGMTLNGNSTSIGYKILWLRCNGNFAVYDSVQDSWTCLGMMPPSIRLPLSLSYLSQGVPIGNSLYFMRGDPDGILSYDMASGVWKQYIIPLPPHLTDHALAECRGQVMLVGLLSKNPATCVCVWELQKMTLLWNEVDRMPSEQCLDFYGKQVKMRCLGNRGLLMLSLVDAHVNHLVTYDLLSRKWKGVPGLSLPHRRKKEWIAFGTTFTPCLTASP